MEYLLLVPSLILAVLFWRKERQLEDVLRASETARKEQAEAAAKERDTLVAQIHAPETSVSIAAPEPTGELLHVPLDDDVAHDEYIEDRRAGLVR